MKKLSMIVMMAIGLSSVAFTQTNNNKKTGDEQAVRQVINELLKALQTSNTAELNRIYASDFTFVNVDGVLTTKAQRIAALKTGKIKYKSLSLQNVKIRIYGDAAVANFSGEAKFASGNENLDGQFMTTSTFVKTNGRWEEVAAQSAKISK
ncbi:MAG: nuclear transport factor 2 family protein [Bacteroidota bacterium]|nr:nuclear transport factor 2 family protein [Bacteroidota bacterium]